MAAGHGGQVLLSAATREGLGVRWETLPLGEHRLKDLLQGVPLFQLVVPGLPAAFPPLRTLGSHPTNLPVQRDPLVGRGAEIAEVAAMIRDRDAGPLVTLTGPGGTGKTRLALHVAAELVEDHAGGRSRTPWRHGRWRASRPRTCWRATWPARRCCRCWTTSSSAAAAPGPSAAVPRPRRFGRRPAAADPVRRDRLELSRELQRLLA